MNNPIPEDLQSRVDDILLNAADNGGEFESDEDVEAYHLIERIGRVEQDNAKLKAQVKRLSAPVSDQEQADYANRLSDGDEDHPCDRLFDVADGKTLGVTCTWKPTKDGAK